MFHVRNSSGNVGGSGSQLTGVGAHVHGYKFIKGLRCVPLERKSHNIRRANQTAARKQLINLAAAHRTKVNGARHLSPEPRPGTAFSLCFELHVILRQRRIFC